MSTDFPFLLRLAVVVGIVCVSVTFWYGLRQRSIGGHWRRWFVLGSWMALAAGSLALALQPHRGFLLPGLPLGLVLIGMLWDGPAADTARTI